MSIKEKLLQYFYKFWRDGLRQQGPKNDEKLKNPAKRRWLQTFFQIGYLNKIETKEFCF